MRGRDRVEVLRRDPGDDERVTVDRVPVTTRALTVLDAVAELGPAAGADLMDRALLRDRVTADSLRDAHWQSLGRRGSRAAGDALVLAASGARFAGERRLHRHLREHGVDGWVADLAVVLPGYGDAVLDLAFPDRRVLVEIERSTPIGGGRTTATSTTSVVSAAGRTPSCSPGGPSCG